MKAKVCIIGHFGKNETLLNGQTVKTKIITEELQNQIGADEIIKIDTHGGLKTLLKAPFQAFSSLKRSKNVIIFPAQNGLRIFAPLLAFFRRFFKNRKLHYVVIGGWLPEFLSGRKRLTKALKSFDAIYVETNTMKASLEAQEFCNIYVMPNCKKLTVLSEDELVYPDAMPYKLCTFSRVMKEKGIEDAVNAVKAVNEELGYQAYSLDIYGQIDFTQSEWFDELKKTFPAYINYGGCVPYDKSVEVLKNYFALLFPTYYKGEGFAGTLIDAFSAGVPVIASDWKYNSEIVNEAVGFVYPCGDQIALAEILKTVAEDATMLLCKKRFCLIETGKYKVNNVVRVLHEKI